MSELPKGWSIRHLGGPKGLTSVINGSTPSTDQPEYWNGDILWVTPTDVGNLSGVYLLDSERRITQKGLESCSATLVPPGTVLMTSRAPVGNLAIAAKELCTNQGFKSFVPKENVNSEYLYYYLKFIIPAIQKDSHGNTFTEITKTQVEKTKIVIPDDVDLQVTIARELQSRLTHVEAMRQAAFKQVEGIESLSAAILREAFDFGKGETE